MTADDNHISVRDRFSELPRAVPDCNLRATCRSDLDWRTASLPAPRDPALAPLSSNFRPHAAAPKAIPSVRGRQVGGDRFVLDFIALFAAAGWL